MKTAVALLLFILSAAAVRADEIVTLNFNETTIIDPTPGEIIWTGVPLTFETPNEILSIGIDWAATGDEPPFPIVYGFTGNVVLGGTVVDSLCNYLSESPSGFFATDCTTLDTPYTAMVMYSGTWGSAMLGFGGSEPIDIFSTFSEQTVTPEPKGLGLLLLGILALAFARNFYGLKLHKIR